MERIHLDHNATTPMRAEAREALLEAMDAGLGNASSVHASGRRARAVVDDARMRIAAALGVTEDEVVFTSGGTEANNLALLGAVEARGSEVGLVTTAIEHAAVLAPAERIAAAGRRVDRVPVDAEGRVDVQRVGELARAHPSVVSVMAANNEIGSTVDLAAVREAIGPRTVFHTDAVQILGKRAFDPCASGVDLATLSAHKVGGPIGIGILLRRGSVPIAARTFGGAQEAELRPGTENVPAIAAAAVAIELAVRETEDYARHTRALARELWEGLTAQLPDVRLNGPPLGDATRLPNTLNVAARSGDARTLVVRLDLEGLEVSAGSACASGSIEPSHVLLALGLDAARATSSVRISLGRTTSSADIHRSVERLGRILGEAA
ncbi:MAG: cysteine desulfurase family protein [Planctomycetota bacterium]